MERARYTLRAPPINPKSGKATTIVAHEGKNPYDGLKKRGNEPTTEVRAPPG